MGLRDIIRRRSSSYGDQIGDRAGSEKDAFHGGLSRKSGLDADAVAL